MDQFQVLNIKEGSCDIIYNGEKYRVSYDYYMGDYRFSKGAISLNGPYGRYYYGDEKISGSRFTSVAFKEGFITERLYEAFKPYRFRLLYRRRGNEYVSPDGIFVKGIKNCECAFFHNGKYTYLSIGSDGYPTVEKSFSSLAGIKAYVEKRKAGSKGHVTIDAKSAIAGALTVGGLALAKKIFDAKFKKD